MEEEALLQGHHFMGSGAEEAEGRAAGTLRDMKPPPVTVAVLPGRREELRPAGRLQAADSAKGVGEDVPFCRPLDVVGQMLPLAPPAVAEDRTAGANAAGIRLHEFDDLTAAEGTAVLDDPDTGHISGGGAGNEDHLAAGPSESLAAPDESLHGNFKEAGAGTLPAGAGTGASAAGALMVASCPFVQSGVYYE